MLTIEGMRRVVEETRIELAEREDELNRLDHELGDGDHGRNMCRGFESLTECTGQPFTSLGVMLSRIGATLMKSVGGTAGTLYGMALRATGQALGDTDTADVERMKAALMKGAEAIAHYGCTERGQKTMLDVWAPLAERIDADTDVERLLEQLLREMRPLAATLGHAALYADVSVGKDDPGALSSSIFLRHLMEETLHG